MIALLLLVACPTRPTAAADGSVPFPHPASMAEGAVHGPLATDAGAGACNACHGEAGSAARPCASCHADYPHAAGWLAGSRHGAGLTGDPGAEARQRCDACHAAEDSIAATTAPCTGCHPSYPHQRDWGDPGQHGRFALDRGSPVAACGSCHGTALEGSGNAPACTSCHPSYPHAGGWTAGEHGAAFLADPTACEGCHGTGGSGGNAGVTCTQCHLAMPHADEWRRGHLAAASAAGAQSCATCHDPGDGTAGMPAASGAPCHGDAP